MVLPVLHEAPDAPSEGVKVLAIEDETVPLVLDDPGEISDVGNDWNHSAGHGLGELQGREVARRIGVIRQRESIEAGHV